MMCVSFFFFFMYCADNISVIAMIFIVCADVVVFDFVRVLSYLPFLFHSHDVDVDVVVVVVLFYLSFIYTSIERKFVYVSLSVCITVLILLLYLSGC